MMSTTAESYISVAEKNELYYSSLHSENILRIFFSQWQRWLQIILSNSCSFYLTIPFFPMITLFHNPIFPHNATANHICPVFFFHWQTVIKWHYDGVFFKVYWNISQFQWLYILSLFANIIISSLLFYVLISLCHLFLFGSPYYTKKWIFWMR